MKAPATSQALSHALTPLREVTEALLYGIPRVDFEKRFANKQISPGTNGLAHLQHEKITGNVLEVNGVLWSTNSKTEVPEEIKKMTLKEFVLSRMNDPVLFRLEALQITSPSGNKCPFSNIGEMPILYFIEHCRGWYLLEKGAGNLQFVAPLSMFLRTFGIIWG